MKPIDILQAARMAKGTVLRQFDSPPIDSITIDSRKAGPGSLFVALGGSRQDGHGYVADAFANGAAAAMIASRQAHGIKARLGETRHALIIVDDPLTALQSMAGAHVRAYPEVRTVGITGSCGKTTTKEMVASILSRLGPTAKTPGNLNSEIGFPISVFELDETTEFGVFEMGVDHVGEMDRMLDIWRPEVAVITTIGLSHAAGMGTLQVIAKEKSKLFYPGIPSAFISENNAWTPSINRWRAVAPAQFGTVSTEGIESVEPLGLHGWRIGYQGKIIHLKAIGRHNLMDALAAISVAQVFGADSTAIAGGLEDFSPVSGRSRIMNGPVTIIEDWYNSSVDSTATILDYMGTLPCKGRKRAVLGSMKELGFASERAHEKIGRMLPGSGIDDVYLYGKEMESAWRLMRANGFDRHLCYTDDYEELQQRMAKDCRKGDLVLLKGSRAMAMERLVPVISSIA